MAVKIGSARIDEHGNARGGAAGDQTGRELSTQDWYAHKKGWRVFRAKDPEKSEMIAKDCQWACDNNHIGYDQGQRLTLYNVSRPLGFDCSKVRTKCETDCSALVRVCCAYAGIMLPDFNTTTQPSVLLSSGAFVELKGTDYTDSSKLLRRGDILVTKTQGHTVIVLSNGSQAGSATMGYKLGERTLQNGDCGPDVRELQEDLTKLGYSFPKFGCDGDFGSETEANVRGFQRLAGIEVDGVFGPASYKALVKVLDGLNRFVEIAGPNVNVRKGPGTLYDVIGVVHKGDHLPYGGEQWPDGDRVWYLVEYEGGNGCVSSKYGRLVE